MSTNQFQWVRDALSQREQELRREVQAARDAMQERQALASAEVFDQKDEASERSGEAVDDGSLQRDLEELRRIAAARQRLDDGSYGSCIDCGEIIDLQRLRADRGTPRSRGGPRRRGLQCDMTTGSGDVRISVRVAPPSASSRNREWP